jgi:hypothetical protein
MLELFDNQTGLLQTLYQVNAHTRSSFWSGKDQGAAGNLDLRYELNNISAIRLTTVTSGGVQHQC